MNYSANDPDVTIFLEELKTFTFILGTLTVTGVQNLKTLLLVLETQIEDLLGEASEREAFLRQRQIIVTNLVESIYDNRYKADNIDSRYSGYKSEERNMSSTSNFMLITDIYMNMTFDRDFTQLSQLRREQEELRQVILGVDSQTSNLTTMKTEIATLIQLCDTV